MSAIVCQRQRIGIPQVSVAATAPHLMAVPRARASRSMDMVSGQPSMLLWTPRHPSCNNRYLEVLLRMVRGVVRMTVGGRPLELTAGEVVDRMREQTPESVRAHFVEVSGAVFPPKQVLAAVTGWDRTTFTTMEAQRVLTRLGFVSRRAGSQSGKRPVQGLDAHEQALLSVNQRLATLEAELAVAQEAIASLVRRIAALDGATASGPMHAAGLDALMNQNHPVQRENRDGEDVTMGTQNWRLIVTAARALTAAKQTPFSRIAVYQWIWARHPRADHDRPTLDPTFQGMVENAPGGPPSTGGTPLRRVARGLYVLADHASA